MPSLAQLAYQPPVPSLTPTQPDTDTEPTGFAPPPIDQSMLSIARRATSLAIIPERTSRGVKSKMTDGLIEQIAAAYLQPKLMQLMQMMSLMQGGGW